MRLPRACIGRAKLRVSVLRSGVSHAPPPSPLFLPVCKVRKSDRCIAACITVLCHEQGGRGRLLVRATRVFRPKESAVDRVFSRACVFSLVLDTKPVRRLSRGKYVIRGPWEPLVASSLRSNATFQGSRGPLNHVFSAASASNLYFIGERKSPYVVYLRMRVVTRN